MRREHSVIKGDEEVLFFPGYGRRDGAGGWEVSLRGWVYEPEEDSVSRHLLMSLLSQGLGLRPEEIETATFRKRAWAFLVDNERRKRVAVRLGGAVHTLEPSAANGHFTGTVRLATEAVPGWHDFEAVTADGDDRRFAGQVHLMPDEGISVVSDIDDTVKETEVGDVRTVLANTFLREFRPVSGMADLYSRWNEAGATFHYVSGSPWQLYQPLSEFLAATGFPRGTFHLKEFRLKEPATVKALTKHEESKRRAITALLAAFPRRRFVLVGDSGEQDPEIYARLATEYPQQVARVLIRDVGGRGVAAARFGDLPPELWQVFRSPDELGERP